MVHALQAVGYERDVDIRAAPYDFRRAPNDNPEWMVAMKKLVKETYAANGNRRVTIIGHSLGGLYSLYFLNHQSQRWKDKYISYYIPMGTPFGGVYMVLLAKAMHDLLDHYVPREINWFKLFYENINTMSAVPTLLPNQRGWPKDHPLVSFGNGSKISINEYHKYFKMINDTNGFMMYKDAEIADSGYNYLKHPGVNILCITGKEYQRWKGRLSNPRMISHIRQSI